MAKPKHGLSGTGIYNSWSKMMQRCYTPHNKDYLNYGGRGISVNKEWHNVLMFHAWAIANGWSQGLEIDRENTNGDYEPDNCRWVTSKVNNNNRRNNFLIKAFGKILSASEWSEIVAIGRKTIINRIENMGFTPEEALTTKVGSMKGSNLYKNFKRA